MATEDKERIFALRSVEIIFEGEDQSAIIRRLAPDNPLSQFLVSSLLTERSVDQLIAPPMEAPLPPTRDDVISEPSADFPVSEANAAKQKNPSVVLSGKLKTQPKEGRPDGQGHPTTWARFAAHEEEGARLYSCTFHRGAAKLALGLPTEAAIVVEGYAHPSTQPGKRLDTLSVFRLLQYPGKAPKDS